MLHTNCDSDLFQKRKIRTYVPGTVPGPGTVLLCIRINTITLRQSIVLLYCTVLYGSATNTVASAINTVTKAPRYQGIQYTSKYITRLHCSQSKSPNTVQYPTVLYCTVL